MSHQPQVTNNEYKLVAQDHQAAAIAVGTISVPMLDV
jgi:hypothetical protein